MRFFFASVVANAFLLFGIPVCLLAHPVQKQTNSKLLVFIENAGQIVDQHYRPRTDIDLKLSNNGAALFVGSGQLHYQWYKSNKPAPTKEKPEDIQPGMQPAFKRTKDSTHELVEIYRMDVELVGANMQVTPVKEEMQRYSENYYLPQCPDGTTAHTYTRVTYKDIYPGIDWVLYSKDGRVKYDFVVHAGADANQIKLQYTGATNLQIKNGELLVETPFGIVQEGTPYTYEATSKHTVSSHYIITDNTVQIQLGAHEGDVVIDPELVWGTYYGDVMGGSSAYDEGFIGTAADKWGNAAVVGVTTSTNNVATTGAQQTTLVGTYDGLIVFFDVNGQPLWGTYYGGTDDERLQAITVDNSGQIYVAGYTNSSNLGTSGTQQPLYSGRASSSLVEEDGIILKLNPANGLRSWATYMGTYDESDGIVDIACDAGGDVYLVGYTFSTTGMITPGAFLTTYPGTSNRGYIARYSGSNGIRTWGTYFPGQLHGLVIDKFDRLYISGTTSYTSGIATTGAFNPTFPAFIGYADFFARFNTAGNRIWGSYTLEPAYFGHTIELACDDAGDLYVCGITELTTGIATTGTHKTTLTPFAPPAIAGADMYLWKFSPSGSRIWGTYYGGENIDWPSSITTDHTGNVYVWGTTVSNSDITTVDGLNPSKADPNKSAFFLSAFNQNGQLKYGTYIGEDETIAGGDGVGWTHVGCPWAWTNNAISYGKGYVYAAGVTTTQTGFTTLSAFKPTHSGGNDGFLLQFAADTSVFIIQPFTDTALCKGQALLLDYDVTHPFKTGNVFTAQLSDASGSFASPTNIGTVTATGAGTINCTIPTTITTGAGYRIRIVATTPVDTSYDNLYDIKIGPSRPTGVLASSNSPVCSPGSNLSLAGTSTTSGVSYYWHGPNGYFAAVQSPTYVNPPLSASGDYILSVSNSGCTQRDTITVHVRLTPLPPTAGSDISICEGAALNLTAASSSTPGVTYEWTGPSGYNSTVQNPIIHPTTLSNAGDYIVVAKLNGCTSIPDTTNVVINRVSYLGAYASPNDTICEGTLVTFVTVPVNGGTSPQFQWYKNNIPISGATGITYSTSSYVTNDSFYCSMKVTGICLSQLTLFSNKIGMAVLPITTTVEANISSVPSPALPGQPVTFTASVVNGGYNPTYKWKRNGIDVGATTKDWSTNNLHPYDAIHCEVTSSDTCAAIRIVNTDTVIVNFPTTVANVEKEIVQLFPNPVSEILYLKNIAPNATIQVLDITGREVYKGLATTNEATVNTKHLSPGSYLLMITSDANKQVLKFVKE